VLITCHTFHLAEVRGGSRRGVHFAEKVVDQKKKEEQNELRKQQYHYEVKVHNYYSIVSQINYTA